MQTQHFLNSVPHAKIVGIHLQGKCVGVCAFGCVTTYVVLNLFELLTAKLKMKFSDVQVEGEKKFGQNVRTVRVSVCLCVTLQVCTHKRVDIYL